MRARAEISLESATKYGKVDARLAARGTLSLVHFRLAVLIPGFRKISPVRGFSTGN
jgi:hypothetical protein